MFYYDFLVFIVVSADFLYTLAETAKDYFILLPVLHTNRQR